VVFLLVWDSYSGRFLVLFPCMCALHSKLVHLYQTSSLLPSPLPTVPSASLRLLYFSYTVSTSTTFKFSVLPLSYPSHGRSPLSVVQAGLKLAGREKWHAAFLKADTCWEWSAGRLSSG
jgi:hypothetical protein